MKVVYASRTGNVESIIDTGYGEAYCKAGDVIAEQYNVPCLYKVENDGSDEDIEAIKKVIA